MLAMVSDVIQQLAVSATRRLRCTTPHAMLMLHRPARRLLFQRRGCRARCTRRTWNTTFVSWVIRYHHKFATMRHGFACRFSKHDVHTYARPLQMRICCCRLLSDSIMQPMEAPEAGTRNCPAYPYSVQVHWLTLGSTLAPSSVSLFKQLPQLETAAYQVNLTVRPLVPIERRKLVVSSAHTQSLRVCE